MLEFAPKPERRVYYVSFRLSVFSFIHVNFYMPDPTSKEQWDGVDRRRVQLDQSLLLNLLDKIDSLFSKVEAAQTAACDAKEEIQRLRAEFDKHATEETSVIKALYKAFPGEDLDDHHDYHDIKRKSAKSWGEIWFDVKKKVVSGVVWAFIITVGFALLEYIKMVLKQ